MDTMRRESLICLALITAVLLVSWQVRNHEFINYDDNVYVTDNPYVQKGVTLESLGWAFTTTRAGNWHPLTWFSHILDYELYDLNPQGHHLTNILLHIANMVLLFLALRWMTGAVWRSAFVAAMFGLHPLHVESVAWVAERKDVLSTLFWLLTILVYVGYVNRPGVKKYFLVIITFSLGLMAKPMLVTLPFVLLLLDYWPLGRFQFSPGPSSSEGEARGPEGSSSDGLPVLKLVWEKVPLLTLSTVASVITYWAQQSAGALSNLETVPFKLRIANGLVSYLAYIGKMVWPFGLAVFYPHPGDSLPLWKSWVAGFLLVAVSAAVVWVASRYQYLLVGWLWYLGTLVPVIGFVQVGEQAMADRYTYVPLIGLFIIVAWGVADMVQKWRHGRLVLTLSATILLLAMMVGSWLQVLHWQNSINLFRHALSVTTNNYLAHYNLGNALALKGNLAEAIAHYNQALRISPNYPEAHNNLGNALALRGSLDEAIVRYKEALRIKPAYAEAHHNLGVGLDRQGQHVKAMHHYAEAIRIRPDDAQSHNNLGVALAEQGRLNEAIAHFTEALRINPNFTDARRNLEHGLKLMGKSGK